MRKLGMTVIIGMLGLAASMPSGVAAEAPRQGAHEGIHEGFRPTIVWSDGTLISASGNSIYFQRPHSTTPEVLSTALSGSEIGMIYANHRLYVADGA